MLNAGAGVPPSTISALSKSLVLVTPTILVPPVSADCAFPIPGTPEPGENLGSAELKLSGGYRPDGDPLAFYIEAANPRGSLPAMWLRRALSDPASATRMGVRTTFGRWPSATSVKLAQPQGTTFAAWTWIDAAKLLVLDGALYCLHLAKTPGATDCRVVVRQYDERLHTDWEHYSDSGSLETLLSTELAPESFCALADDGNLISFVFCTASALCQFYVLRLHGTTWSAVGSSARTGGSALTGGASACRLPNGGILVAFTKRFDTVGPTTYKFDVSFALSKDLQNWGADVTSGTLQLPKLADVKPAVVPTPELLTRVRKIDDDLSLALTAAGEILASTDDGATWTKHTVPAPLVGARPQLYDIAGAKVAGAYHLYAVGQGGLILRTTDSGTTWEVIAYAAAPITAYDADDVSDSTFKAAGGIQSVAINSINPDKVYICGKAGLLAWSINGGTAWTSQKLGSGALISIIADRYDNAFVVGDVGGFSLQSDANGANAARVKNVTTAAEFEFYSLGERSTLIACACPVITGSLADGGSGWVYAASSNGEVFRVNAMGVDEQIATLPAHPTDLTASGDDASGTQLVAVNDSNDEVWICGNAQASVTDPQPPQFNRHHIGSTAFGLAFLDDDSLIAASVSTVLQITTLTANRCRPELFVTRAGSIIYAVDNMDRGELEVFRGTQAKAGEFPKFTQVLGNDTEGSVGFRFGRIDSPITSAAVINDVPRPSITQDEFGNIILVAGAAPARVSTDDGKTWKYGTDATLELPTGILEVTSQYTGAKARESRSLCAYGSRLFSVMRNAVAFAYPEPPFGTVVADGALATFVSREWITDSGAYAMPVPADKPVWLIDGVKARYLGRPSPGDTWTVEPDYRYPARNLTCQESPKHFWRGPSKAASAVLTPQRVILFDAGAGNLFHVTHFYAYGCNFQRVKIAVSNPADDAEWTEYDSLSTLISGFAAAISVNSGAVVRDSALATLRAHRLAFPADAQPTANRPCYLSMNDLEGAWRCFRVVDNDENGAGGVNYQLDLSPLSVVTPAIPGLIATAYQVWQGSHYWNGVGGTGPGSAGLAGSQYAFSRHVRITIPEQPTAEGYFRGNLLPGVGLDPQPPAGSTDWARSIAPGFSFGLTPNSIEATALDGTSALEHFDEGEAIACAIQAAPDWYVERFNALLSRNRKQRQAMCVVFDSADPNSARLMRLVDGAAHGHATRDYHNIEFAMRGVS